MTNYVCPKVCDGEITTEIQTLDDITGDCRLTTAEPTSRAAALSLPAVGLREKTFVSSRLSHVLCLFCGFSFPSGLPTVKLLQYFFPSMTQFYNSSSRKVSWQRCRVMLAQREFFDMTLNEPAVWKKKNTKDIKDLLQIWCKRTAKVQKCGKLGSHLRERSNK